jgi:ACS family D-galactonate transporter-like MFS transporter
MQSIDVERRSDKASRSSAHRWIIIGLLSVGVLIAYVDRTTLSVCLALQEFKDYFHLTEKDRGTLNAAFFFSYAFLQVPAGWLVDRCGVKWPYAVGFLLWGLVSATTSLVDSVRQLFSVRILLGVGEAVVAPASVRYIRFNFAERERGLALGLYMAGVNTGLATGAGATAWLVSAYGWRPMFVILGLGSLSWLVPWLFLMRENEHPSRAEAKDKPDSSTLSLKRIMVGRVFWGLLIGTFAYNYFFYFCMTWMPAYLVERRNLSLNSMGFYQMLSFGGMAFTATFAGWVADRMIARGGNPLKVRRGFTIAGFLIASTEVIGAQAGSVSVALFFVVFSLTGLGLATTNCWALTQTMMPAAGIGRIIGIQNFVANLAGIVAPILTAWLKHSTGTYEAPLQAIWLILLLGLAAYLFLVREECSPSSLPKISSA